MLSFPQGLEDHFDRKSRRRLDGFIVSEGAGHMFEESEKRDETEVVQHSEVDSNPTLYYVTPCVPDSAGEVEERRALTRLPIFAIFHGIAHERGVPPSFTGVSTSFCSPSLPRSQNPSPFRIYPAVARSSPFRHFPHRVCSPRGTR